MQLLVNIDVDDLARATEFYTRGLGFTVGRRLGDDFLELLGAGVPIYLLLKAAGTAPFTGAAERRHFGRHWTPVHMDLAVDDIVAARQRAIAAGATPEGEIEDHAYGRLAFLADPFGHGVCLLQFTDRGYDAIAT